MALPRNVQLQPPPHSTTVHPAAPIPHPLCISRCEPLPFFRDVVPALLVPAICNTTTRCPTNTVPATPCTDEGGCREVSVMKRTANGKRKDEGSGKLHRPRGDSWKLQDEYPNSGPALPENSSHSGSSCSIQASPTNATQHPPSSYRRGLW